MKEKKRGKVWVAPINGGEKRGMCLQVAGLDEVEVDIGSSVKDEG